MLKHLVQSKAKMSNLTTSIQLTKLSTYKLNNGYSIPVAGYGVYALPKEKTKSLVYKALEVGYRHIDTAQYYYNERECAEGVAAFLKDHSEVKREDVFFTTKIKDPYQGYESTHEAVKMIADEVKSHIGYVDLILIHSPNTSKEKRLGTWKALQEYITDPSHPVLTVRSIGVSNYGVRHFEELWNWEGFTVKPVLNQLELHPWLPRLELRKYLVEHDILVEAYSPLTQGRRINDPELVELEKSTGISRYEILLKWSYLQGFIVLAKTENPDRIKQNLDILPDGSVDELDGTTSYGKVDLDESILEKLNKPDSVNVLTWGGRDSTLAP